MSFPHAFVGNDTCPHRSGEWAVHNVFTECLRKKQLVFYLKIYKLFEGVCYWSFLEKKRTCPMACGHDVTAVRAWCIKKPLKKGCLFAPNATVTSEYSAETD